MDTVLTQPPIRSETSSGDFMPPELTPLYQTACYLELDEVERVNYNQLHALYFHEQIIFFEQSIICPALASVRATCGDAGLSDSIKQFIAEENEHSAQFHKVLKQTAPEMYKQSPRYFIR